jgi:hypothetical protein
MKLRLLILLVCLVALATTGLAQKKGKQKTESKNAASAPAQVEQVKPTSATPPADIIALKPEESAAAIQAFTLVQQLVKKLGEEMDLMLEAPIEKATEVVARAQNTSLRLKIAQLEFNKVKDTHKSTYQCPDCDYTTDGKALQRAKPQLSQAKPQ